MYNTACKKIYLLIDVSFPVDEANEDAAAIDRVSKQLTSYLAISLPCKCLRRFAFARVKIEGRRHTSALLNHHYLFLYENTNTAMQTPKLKAQHSLLTHKTTSQNSHVLQPSTATEQASCAVSLRFHLSCA